MYLSVQNFQAKLKLLFHIAVRVVLRVNREKLIKKLS